MSAYIPQPIYDSDFTFVDADADFIANYLFTNVNDTFSQAYPDGIIRTYRSFNDITIPLIDYPCLKVYRTSETPFTSISAPRSTEFTISYVLSYTQQQPTADVSYYVATEIIRNLMNACLEEPVVFQMDLRTGTSVQYETFVDPSNRIFKYANISVNIYTTFDSSNSLI